jgi:ABC-2 type transport system permease protein
MIDVLCRQLRFFNALLRLNVGVTVAYRGDFVIMQIGNLIVPVTSLLVWQAVLASGADLPVTGRYLTAYFVLVAVVEMLTSSWTAFYLAESIRDGSLNQWLIRPTSTHLNGIANNVGEKVIKLVLLVPFIAALAVLIRLLAPAGHGFEVPTAAGRWIWFLVSLVLAAAIRFALDVGLGSLAFWFSDVSGFLRATAVIVPILSGAVVPLALLPTAWQWLASVQPFRFILSFPMEVLLGAPSATATAFAGQLAWAAGMIIAAALTWRLGLRSYSAIGA